MANDPLEAVARLERRCREVLAPLGLDLHAFVVAAGKDGGPGHAQAILLIDTDKVGRDLEAEAKAESERGKYDAAFAQLTAGLEGEIMTDKDAEAEARFEEARQRALRLQERLKEGGGDADKAP